MNNVEPALIPEDPWQMPDILRATVDARRAMFAFPLELHPDVSAEINQRLRSL